MTMMMMMMISYYHSGFNARNNDKHIIALIKLTMYCLFRMNSLQCVNASMLGPQSIARSTTPRVRGLSKYLQFLLLQKVLQKEIILLIVEMLFISKRLPLKHESSIINHYVYIGNHTIVLE